MAGVDEVGRGPLAGPVVAAAVLLEQPSAVTLPQGINDSKKLSIKRRTTLFDSITARSGISWSIGLASVDEIDNLNILEASMLAMTRAIKDLPQAPMLALVDGTSLPDLDCPALAVPGGDSKCDSVAAASIVAKVIRDRIMDALSVAHPFYGWEKNRGYPTAAHRKAIMRAGITCHHRRSFGPVRAILENT